MFCIIIPSQNYLGPTYIPPRPVSTAPLVVARRTLRRMETHTKAVVEL